MGKAVQVRQKGKLSAPVLPVPVKPHARKDTEMMKMQQILASTVDVSNVNTTSFNYKRIKRNIYVSCKRPTTARASFCTCSCPSGSGCSGKCELRRVHLECHKSCTAALHKQQNNVQLGYLRKGKEVYSETDAGDGIVNSQSSNVELTSIGRSNSVPSKTMVHDKFLDCGNQRLQRFQYARTAIYPAGKKGYGLFALAPIQRGALVSEYVGEVITREECMRRKRAATGHIYFLALDKGLYIDAAHKGNESRFINHSCDPNCEVQLWYVGDEPRAAIITRRNVAIQEELSFDYKFDAIPGVEPKYPCFCGSIICRGHIDAPRVHKQLN